MEGLLSQISGTVTLRPYFVAFFMTYLLACSLHLGVKRALIFAIVGYLIAWLSEVSSIHNGIPYGFYHYIESTRGRELWVAGIPFMDSMSFVFLSYASYSMALASVSPILIRGGIYVLENRKIRRCMTVRLLGALFFTYLDVIIDPVALRGHKWFLGQIYGYPAGGSYFGVPISNFVGWFIVGFFLIYALQLIDAILYWRRVRDWFGRRLTWRYLVGPVLYVSVVIFNLTVAFLIGEFTIFWAGVFVALLPIVLVALTITTRSRMASEQAVMSHLADFPQAFVPARSLALLRSKRSHYPE
jgi:putative membrane protein